MKSFKQYLQESVRGNYVSIDVETPIVIPVLEKLFGGSHVCEPKDQHVTLVYSKESDVPTDKILSTLHHYDQEIECKINSVEAFDSTPKNGERDSNECTIVLKLDSPILHEIHNRLIKERRLKHSYPEYSPHISILYNLPIDRKEEALSVIRKWLPGNMDTVTLRGFNASPIKEDWAEKRNV